MLLNFDSLYEYKGPKLAIGINQNDYSGHVKEIIDKMLINLK